MMGHNAYQEGGGQAPPDMEELLKQFGFGGGGGGGGGGFGGFGDFFDLFGGGGGGGKSRRQSRGSNIEVCSMLVIALPLIIVNSRN